jgi:hypothetical protein
VRIDDERVGGVAGAVVISRDGKHALHELVVARRRLLEPHVAEGRPLRGVPPQDDADLIFHDAGRRALKDTAVLGQPRFDLSLQLFEVERAHEKDAEAEDHIDHRRHVDGDGVVGCFSDVL